LVFFILFPDVLCLFFLENCDFCLSVRKTVFLRFFCGKNVIMLKNAKIQVANIQQLIHSFSDDNEKKCGKDVVFPWFFCGSIVAIKRGFPPHGEKPQELIKMKTNQEKTHKCEIHDLLSETYLISLNSYTKTQGSVSSSPSSPEICESITTNAVRGSSASHARRLFLLSSSGMSLNPYGW